MAAYACLVSNKNGWRDDVEQNASTADGRESQDSGKGESCNSSQYHITDVPTVTDETSTSCTEETLQNCTPTSSMSSMSYKDAYDGNMTFRTDTSHSMSESQYLTPRDDISTSHLNIEDTGFTSQSGGMVDGSLPVCSEVRNYDFSTSEMINLPNGHATRPPHVKKTEAQADNKNKYSDLKHKAVTSLKSVRPCVAEQAVRHLSVDLSDGKGLPIKNSHRFIRRSEDPHKCNLYLSNSFTCVRDAYAPSEDVNKCSFVNGHLFVKGALDSHTSFVTCYSEMQCIKGSEKSHGPHVQFESPAESEERDLFHSSVVCKGGKDNFSDTLQMNSLTRLLSRVQKENDTADGNASLQRSKKKRNTQPHLCSGISISLTGSSDTEVTEFERKAPDGGWGWVVVFASFMVHCIADGVTMSFGVLFVQFLEYFGESIAMTSWIGSLFMAVPLLAGPIASLLTDRCGCRRVTIAGAIVSCLGFFVSIFAESIAVLYFTIGLISGLGLAVCYVAAIVSVAFYFEKRRSLATGIAVAGSGIGTFLFAPVIQFFLDYYAWRGCLLLIAGIFLNMSVFGALMRDLEWTPKKKVDHGAGTTVASSRQNSFSQSLETLGCGGASTALPSVDELRWLVQSGDVAAFLSSDERDLSLNKSASLVLLPTYLNHKHSLPPDLLSCLKSTSNAYEVVCHYFPHLLSRSLSGTSSQADFRKGVGEQKEKTVNLSESEPLSCQRNEVSESCQGKASPGKKDSSTQTETEEEEVYEADEGSPLKGILNPEKSALAEVCPSLPVSKPSKIYRPVYSRRDSSCLGFGSHLPSSPLRDMKINRQLYRRQSMTFRGAMLNIHRYRLRASSCPDIYRNSIVTITDTEDQNLWSCMDDVKRMMGDCIDMEHCKDPAYLIFSLSNLILYIFYDTVYMYLTDYAQLIDISSEDSASLISAIGILNCIGMVSMGYIGDKEWSSPMLIYNVSMVICGMSVIAMPFIVDYWLIALAAAIFGFFISANYALTAVILVEIVSLEAFSKSYGLLLLIQGIANLIGPPFVGLMADTTGNYTLPFVVSGIFIIVCGLMLSLIPAAQKCKAKRQKSIIQEKKMSHTADSV